MAAGAGGTLLATWTSSVSEGSSSARRVVAGGVGSAAGRQSQQTVVCSGPVSEPSSD